jgi:O-phosphoseryl-tRNA(Cys) synthetase
MENFNNERGCSCGSGCCDISTDTKDDKKRIVIDLLFLDLSVCTRCQGADTSLDDALADVSKVLEATGVEVLVNKVHVLSEELAKEYQFVSSPTIRVNGRDIQMEVKESLCESCGDLCGDDVDCRVWVYQGQEYTVPPKAMITEAILQEVYGSNDKKEEKQEYIIPENLKRFYETMKKKNGEISNRCC